MQHALQAQLEERVGGPLDVDDRAAVLERSPRIAVGDAPGDLVGEQEAEPEQNLEREICPATRRETALGCGLMTEHEREMSLGNGRF